ncbi:Serine incorporator [Arachis hypogaea]|nr:Serine incorporator [Arachis hypogaea]
MLWFIFTHYFFLSFWHRIFLFLQLVSVVHFITWWSHYWIPDEEIKHRWQRRSLGIFMSTLFYVASLCGVVYMYKSYASRSSCSLNIFFITWTAILLAVMMAVSLHPKDLAGIHEGRLALL